LLKAVSKKRILGAAILILVVLNFAMGAYFVERIGPSPDPSGTVLLRSGLNTSLFAIHPLVFLASLCNVWLGLAIMAGGFIQVIVVHAAKIPEIATGVNLFFIVFSGLAAHTHKRQVRGLIETSRNKLHEAKHAFETLKDTRQNLAHSFSVLEQRLERFPRLRVSIEKLAQSLDMDKVLDVLAEASLELLPGAEVAQIFLHDRTSDHLLLKRFRSTHPNERAETISDDEADNYVFQQMRPYVCEDTTADRFSRKANVTRTIGSFVACPMLAIIKRGNEPSIECLGVLRVDNCLAHRLAHEDLELLIILSQLGTVALQNAEAFQETEELAIRDSLTGLYLPHYFRERLAGELNRAQRQGLSFGMIMLDIDFFKKYNDQYGHRAGDEALQEVAGIIERHAVPGSIEGRYGGEEFIILHPGGKKTVSALAQAIRCDLESCVFHPDKDEKTARMTISLGVAFFPEHAGDGADGNVLIAHADEALYASKTGGRNRVTLFAGGPVA